MECQPIAEVIIISLLYVGQVLKGADRLVNFFVRDQNGMLIEHRPLTASGQTNTPVHFGGKLKIMHGKGQLLIRTADDWFLTRLSYEVLTMQINTKFHSAIFNKAAT